MGITWEEKDSNVSAFWVYINGLSLSVSYPPPGHFPLPVVSFSELLRGVTPLHLPKVLPRHPSLPLSSH